MTPSYVGSVLTCSCKWWFGPLQTLMHVSIAWGASTNPSAEANPQTNALRLSGGEARASVVSRTPQGAAKFDNLFPSSVLLRPQHT